MRGARAWLTAGTGCAGAGWAAGAARGAGAGAASRLGTVAGPLRLELCTSHPASSPCSGLPGLPVGSWAGLQGLCG